MNGALRTSRLSIILNPCGCFCLRLACCLRRLLDRRYDELISSGSSVDDVLHRAPLGQKKSIPQMGHRRRNSSPNQLPRQATISNPNTSQETKEHSRQVVQELGGRTTESTCSSSSMSIAERRLREEEEAAIETSRGDLLGGNAYHESVLGDTAPALSDDTFAGKDPSRVPGGYKAALNNRCSFFCAALVSTHHLRLIDSNTSEGTKERARSELEQHDMASLSNRRPSFQPRSMSYYGV